MRCLRHHYELMNGLVLAAMLLVSFGAEGAISEGVRSTNAAVAEQQRIAQFDAAERSYQDKLRVGRERYEQKQVVRAKVVEAMTAQYRARQQSILGPPAIQTASSAEAEESPYQVSLAQVLLAAVVIGYGIYLRRLRAATAVVRKRPKNAGRNGARAGRPRYKVTALKPVVIWANVEVAKSERTLLGGTAKRTMEAAAWVELKGGEIRDHLGSVIGIHPNCVPNGKRIFLTAADIDIVPLGAWSDRDLPKNFYEYFKLEVSN